MIIDSLEKAITVQVKQNPLSGITDRKGIPAYAGKRIRFANIFLLGISAMVGRCHCVASISESDRKT